MMDIKASIKGVSDFALARFPFNFLQFAKYADEAYFVSEGEIMQRRCKICGGILSKLNKTGICLLGHIMKRRDALIKEAGRGSIARSLKTKRSPLEKSFYQIQLEGK